MEREGHPGRGRPILDRGVPLLPGSTLNHVVDGDRAAVERKLEDWLGRPSIGQERVHTLNLTSGEAVIDMQVEAH